MGNIKYYTRVVAYGFSQSCVQGCILQSATEKALERALGIPLHDINQALFCYCDTGHVKDFAGFTDYDLTCVKVKELCKVVKWEI